MSASAPKKTVAGIFGFGAVACAACCAGPVIGFLAAAGLLTAGGVAIFGVAELLLIIPAALWLRRRRANNSSCATPTPCRSRSCRVRPRRPLRPIESAPAMVRR